MQAADDEHLVKISRSIKGYHAFHIRPPINIDLNIEIENNNRYDENAVLVKIPDLVDLPEHVLDQLPEGSNQRPLRQLAGRPVGRVPANVCKAFKQLLQTQMAKKVICRYTGMAAPSRNPPSHQRFHRTNRIFDIPGGGAELSCDYFILINKSHFREAMRVLENCIPFQDLDARLSA
ncbi:Hypothetical predicted protein [Mytilus galloprovincialis]|uniref:Uncharacterized protein n=1 Tax=Mytilus galloprovincialis TaxID=29158 RepID=A0A8B6FW16_MYTGA|nr:Hypothetical predicted protein [Mytilus galloprovincialis]